MKPLDFSTSLLATFSTGNRGIGSMRRVNTPAEPLELYDIEVSPYCRIVRETLTALDLDVIIYPCPKGGKRFRGMLESVGGKQQFPYLYDANTDTGLYESADIIRYLHNTYGNTKAPANWRLKGIQTASAYIASGLRYGKGMHAKDGGKNEQALILYSFESSPYARPVRELLCELELHYEVKQMGRTERVDWLLPALRKRFAPDYKPTQRNRVELLERAGRVAVPYLIDPNTGAELFESTEIIAYLKRTYGANA